MDPVAPNRHPNWSLKGRKTLLLAEDLCRSRVKRLPHVQGLISKDNGLDLWQAGRSLCRELCRGDKDMDGRTDPSHLALRTQCGGVNTGVGNKEAASALRVTEGSGDEAMFGRN